MAPFIVKPYLQLGDAPRLSNPESVVVMWHAADQDLPWAVEVKRADSDQWTPAHALSWRRVAAATIEPHRVYSAVLSGLPPGAEFDYRVRIQQDIVFTARGKARKPADQPYRMVVMADCGFDTPGQKAVACQIARLNPDVIIIPGDIIYMWGRISEYRQKYFPIYNADQASPEVGAPLHSVDQTNDPSTWGVYTHLFIANTHSFTVMDVEGSTLTVRQVSETGHELDRFTVTK